MMFDDISPEEEALYLGYGKPGEEVVEEDEHDAIDAYDAPPPPKRSFGLLEEEEEEDAKPQSRFLVQQEMMEDKDLSGDPLMQMDWQVSIRRMGPRPVVPCDVGMAAETIVQAAKMQRISVSAAVLSELEKLTHQVDEFTRIDPLVVVSTTLAMSDTFSAYLEEQMPVSLYLLARATHARFQVLISEKTKTRPVSFSDPTLLLSVAPFTDGEERGTPFRIEERLDVDDAKLLQIRAYMISLGKLSPREACDLDFLEAQEEMFKSILSGETVIVRPKKKNKV